MDRIDLRAKAARCRAGRASIGCPNGSSVAIDSDAVRPSPRPLLECQLRPVANDAVGIRATVDWRELVSLGGAAALLCVYGCVVEHNPAGRDEYWKCDRD